LVVVVDCIPGISNKARAARSFSVLVEQSLPTEAILIADQAENASSVLSTLSAKVAQTLGVDAEHIERAVVERERARTTAFPNGSAVPHCRLAGLKRFCIGMMILRQPVRWDNEGHAVDTVILIVGPSENVSDHLRILANCSRLLDSSAVRAKLKRAPDAESVHALMAAAEGAIEHRRSREGVLRELRPDADQSKDELSEVANRFEW
jgi:PTS system nitrogen regulatory IIA component